MRRQERWIVFCAVLWLSACSTLPRPVGPDNKEQREAAVRTRWIGVTTLWTRSCPVPPGTSGWTVRPLFPQQGLAPDLRKSARKAKLNRFCVYEYTGNAPVPVLPQEISAHLRSVEPDRIALSGAASLEEMTWKPFYERFLGQVQIPEAFPIEDTSRVRLVFLDTQPDGEGVAPSGGRSPHGYTLTHIAGHLAGPLACRAGESSCAVEIASRLALPLVRFEEGREHQRDLESGGFSGTFDDLTQALWAEIIRWKEKPPSLRPSHLVLNLSVGWDGEKLGGWEESLTDMSPDVQAVYRALKVAGDEGILVIAAAGNERGGPAPTGQPLLPGGWEKQARLSKRGWIWKRSGKPFIYAVSGVDGRGRPLVNTREQGEAPRVAYADHVVVPDLHKPESKLEIEPGKYTATLTGTSVASAVVSAIAAVVWSYRPDLTPAQVMETLSRSGDLLPRKHDFSAASDPSPDVRRISLCRALAKARPTSGAYCPPPISEPGLLEPKLSAFSPDSTMGVILTSRTFPPRGRDLDPWIGTQPGVDPCPNCAVTGPPDLPTPAPPPREIAVVANASPRSYESAALSTTTYTNDFYKLRVEIPGGWSAGALQGAVLELFRFDPSTGRKVPLSGSSIDAPPSLQSGDTLEVTFTRPAQPFQATLSFVLAPSEDAPPGTTSLSVESPLFVD